MRCKICNGLRDQLSCASCCRAGRAIAASRESASF
jgi:hypothetical protein